MNDIILSGLLNLFALFGAENKVDKDASLELIIRYLKKFYGIRNTASYSNLYSALRDYYDFDENLDKESIIGGICSNLSTRIREDEKVALLMRLMEFCSKQATFNPNEEIFASAAGAFGISEDVFAEMASFISRTPGKYVRVIDAGEGKITTFFIKRLSLMLFAYDGQGGATLNDVPVINGIFQQWEQSSVLTGSDFKPMYYSSVVGVYEPEAVAGAVELRGDAMEFRFSNAPGSGLHNFSFSLHSGELVAIMGGSGVGKTTLLSLLNGSLRPQSGSITINGRDILDPSVKSLVGYVPQDDLLIEELTVYQNLWYTAKLCFADMKDEDVDAKVLSVLSQLGLIQAKDLKVGSPMNKFISGGQRKRLNIALELIREPSILFLDEPTSGLSSSDTENVIHLLKEQTYKGKLVVANIHQPSSDVYKMFDRLWLLDKGGYPVYDGNPIEAVSYFKCAANYADYQTSSCPVCGNVNPEIILNIIDEKRLDNAGTVTEERKITPVEWHEMYLKNRPELPEPDNDTLPHTEQKRPDAFKQTWLFLSRNVRAKVTNLQYMLVTLLEAPVLAAICASLTKFCPSGEEYSLMENKNFPIYIFMSIIVAVFLGMSGSAEEIIRDRSLLKREKFLNLSYGSYISSKIIYMVGVSLVQTILFLAVGNSIIGVNGMFGYWFLILFVSSFLSSIIGLLLSQCMNSVVAIYITIPILLIPQILLCGLVVDFSDLTPSSKTGNVPVIGDVVPSRWAYEALAVASFSMNGYEREIFDADKERYEALYFEEQFAYELESCLETIKDAARLGQEADPSLIRTIKTELPFMTQVCGLPPYEGDESYESLSSYISDMKDILSNRGNKTTLALDRKVVSFINEFGKEEYLALKRANFNIRLEQLVVNSGAKKAYDVVDSHIVPRAGFIYLTPRSHNGRAPFYSGVKVLGGKTVRTFWFNLCVMILMCVILGALLFNDIPGKYVRKRS